MGLRFFSLLIPQLEFNAVQNPEVSIGTQTEIQETLLVLAQGVEKGSPKALREGRNLPSFLSPFSWFCHAPAPWQSCGRVSSSRNSWQWETAGVNE